MAQENGVTLEFIGKQLTALREDMKGVKDRLDKIEKGQDRVALMETRDKDLAGDLAAIAKIIERAGLLKEER